MRRAKGRHKLWKRTASVLASLALGISGMTWQAMAATVDDARELVGFQKSTYEGLGDDYQSIASKYIAAEQHNFAAALGELGVNKDEDTEAQEAQNRQVQAEIEAAENEMVDRFVSNEPVELVQESLTKVEAAKAKLVEIQEKGVHVQLEYVENRYTEEYRRLVSLLNSRGDDFNIGDLGSDMRVFTEGYHKIVEPFGEVKMTSRTEIQHNDGVTWSSAEGASVLSQWNGTVTMVYESATRGASVEIGSGSGMLVTYSGLKEVYVVDGSEVAQYQQIGTSSGNVYMTVKIDGIYVNPLLLYGSRGVTFYSEWATENPGLVVNQELAEEVRDYTETLTGYDKWELVPKETPAATFSPEEMGDAEVVEAHLGSGAGVPNPKITWEDTGS